MSKLGIKPTVAMTITLELEEREARALHALTVYGENEFLKYFYQCLGQSALKPHEAGLRSLFDSAKKILPQFFNKADDARRAFEDKPWSPPAPPSQPPILPERERAQAISAEPLVGHEQPSLQYEPPRLSGMIGPVAVPMTPPRVVPAPPALSDGQPPF